MSKINEIFQNIKFQIKSIEKKYISDSNSNSNNNNNNNDDNKNIKKENHHINEVR